MAASSRAPQPFLQPVNGSGVPYPGGKLICYQANTTTPQATYSDAALSVPNANPVVADGNGRFPAIFLGDGLTYDLVFTDANDTVIWTAEDVAAPNIAAASTSTSGIVELATNAEALVGTDPSRVPPVSAVAQMIHQGFGYATAGGTANAITAAPSVAPVALAAGMEVAVRIVSNNTGATTLNLSSLGVVSVRKLTAAGYVALTNGDLLAGTVARFTYDASAGFWVLNVPAAPQVVALPGFQNLLITNGGATTNITFTADFVVAVDSNNLSYAKSAFSVTVDCTTTGANGLDTGALAATTEYHIWAIYNPSTNTWAGLASLSPTAPTMPSGYTHKVRAGCMITGGAATFLRTRQIGRDVSYVVTAGSTTTVLPSLVSVAASQTRTAIVVAGSTGAGNARFVPSTASKIRINIQVGPINASNMHIAPNNDAGYTVGATVGAGNPPGGFGSSTNGLVNVSTAEFVLESTSLYYSTGAGASNTNNFLTCMGWTDRVNA